MFLHATTVRRRRVTWACLDGSANRFNVRKLGICRQRYKLSIVITRRRGTSNDDTQRKMILWEWLHLRVASVHDRQDVLKILKSLVQGYIGMVT